MIFVIFTCSVTHLKFLGLNFFIEKSLVRVIPLHSLKIKLLEGLGEARVLPISKSYPSEAMLLILSEVYMLYIYCTVSIFQNNVWLFLNVFNLGLSSLPPKAHCYCDIQQPYTCTLLFSIAHPF